jgi:2'-5' RNA ligase
MSNQEICELYDSNPHITLKQLSNWTGKSVSELKRILMS